MADMLFQKDSWIFAIYRTRKIVMVLAGLNVAFPQLLKFNLFSLLEAIKDAVWRA